MTCKIQNTTNRDMSATSKIISDYFPYAKKEMGFDKPVTVIFKSDLENAKDPLGKTAYYDPASFKIVLYTDGRHPKDIARSFSHELVHHKQNCTGELEGVTGEQGYAQTERGSDIEGEAYLLGNKYFRNWTDLLKETTYYKRGDNIMNEQTLREAIRKALLNSSAFKKYRKIKEEARKSPEEVVEEDTTSEEVSAENEAKEPELKEVISKAIKSLLEKEKKGKKKPDGDGDGVPPWADKDDDDPEVQEETVQEAGRPHSMRGGRTMADLDKDAKTRETDFLKKKEGEEEEEAQDEEEVVAEEKPLKEWYGGSLHKKLIKEYTRRKR